MTVLGIESATVELGAAVADETCVRALVRVRSDRRHAEFLHAAIERVLFFAGIEMKALEAIAVDAGPGRFTGIRVGLATAKALGYALSIPLVPLRSTEVLLHGFPSSELPVVAVVDLRRGELAVEHGDDDAAIGPLRCTPEELGVLLRKRYAHSGVLLVGDGARRYSDELAAHVFGVSLGDERSLAPDVGLVASLGEQRLRMGAVMGALDVDALYLKDADIRISFPTRQHGATVVAT